MNCEQAGVAEIREVAFSNAKILETWDLNADQPTIYYFSRFQ